MAKTIKILAKGLTGQLDPDRWNTPRGFGFIRLDAASAERLGDEFLFVHVSDLPDELTEGRKRQRRLKKGEWVFETQLTFNAEEIRATGKRRAAYVETVTKVRREQEEAQKAYLETRRLGSLRFQPWPAILYQRKMHRVSGEWADIAKGLGGGYVSFRFDLSEHAVNLHAVTDEASWEWGNSSYSSGREGGGTYYPGVKRVTIYHDAETGEKLETKTPTHWDVIRKPSDLVELGEETDVTFEVLEEVTLQLARCLNKGVEPGTRGFWKFGTFGVPDWLSQLQSEDLPDWLAEKVQKWPTELLGQWAIERGRLWEDVQPDPMPEFGNVPPEVLSLLTQAATGETDPAQTATEIVEKFPEFWPIEKYIDDILERWSVPDFDPLRDSLVLKVAGVPDFIAEIRSGEFDPVKEIEGYSGFSPEAPQLIEQTIQEFLSRSDEPDFIPENDLLMLRLVGIEPKPREGVTFLLARYGTLVEGWALNLAGELYELAWEVFHQAKFVKMTEAAAYDMAVEFGFARRTERDTIKFLPMALVHSTDDFFLFRFVQKGKTYLCLAETEEHEFESKIVEFMPALPHFYLNLSPLSDLMSRTEGDIEIETSSSMLKAIGALKKD